jgi:hypothetical protein
MSRPRSEDCDISARLWGKAVGPPLRDVLRRPAELAAKFIQLVLQRSHFRIELSVESLDYFLMQLPEPLKRHLPEFCVLHVQPHGNVATQPD